MGQARSATSSSPDAAAAGATDEVVTGGVSYGRCAGSCGRWRGRRSCSRGAGGGPGVPLAVDGAVDAGAAATAHPQPAESRGALGRPRSGRGCRGCSSGRGRASSGWFPMRCVGWCRRAARRSSRGLPRFSTPGKGFSVGIGDGQAVGADDRPCGGGRRLAHGAAVLDGRGPRLAVLQPATASTSASDDHTSQRRLPKPCMSFLQAIPDFRGTKCTASRTAPLKSHRHFYQ